MKILFDFDGTLTNIQHEYAFELARLESLVCKASGVPSEVFVEWLRRAQAHASLTPERYGWCDHGRVSAFCDEDLFMQVASAMQILDEWTGEGVAGTEAFREGMGTVTFMDLTERAHLDMHAEPLCAFNTPDPEALSVLQTLLDRDCEIVVVSNSPASRIIEKFEHAGMRPVDHDNNPSARFRICGMAGKFVLADSPDPVSFGGRMVDLDRPGYRQILSRERPQAVVGDVFSLDLALPLEMARREPLVYEDMQLYLRVRPYTPQWAIDCMLNPPSDCQASLRLLNHFNDLPSLMLRHG